MAKRGRRIGQKINARDERGWMIPRAGSARRRVYDLMVQGKGVAEIHKIVGISYMACIMQMRHIRKSDRVNALKYNSEHPDTPIHVPGAVAVHQRKRAMPDGTPSQSAEQTIGAFLMMHGIDPREADELAEWLRKDGFLPRDGRTFLPPPLRGPGGSNAVEPQ